MNRPLNHARLIFTYIFGARVAVGGLVARLANQTRGEKTDTGGAAALEEGRRGRDADPAHAARQAEQQGDDGGSEAHNAAAGIAHMRALITDICS